MKLLTQRNEEVIGLLYLGYNRKQIADVLNITIGSVNDHVRRTYSKLGLKCSSKTVGLIRWVMLGE